MRGRNLITKILFPGIAFVIFSYSLFAQNNYKPAVVNVDNEVMCIVESSSKKILSNFTVYDIANNRIVTSLPSLDQKRIFVFNKGEYKISADGISGTLDLQEDCKIIASGSLFKKEALKQPASILFRRNNNFLTTNEIIERREYYLAIYDLDNLSLPASAYKAEIDGIGNIPLNIVKDNNRIISEKPLPAFAVRKDPYVVTVSVSGGTPKKLSFYVREYRFDITVKNLWRGKPLQFGEMEYFRSPSNVNITSLLHKEQDGYLYINDNIYMDISRRAGVESKGPNGETYISTGSSGIIELKDVKQGEQIVLALSGYPYIDPDGKNQLHWYIQILNPTENKLNMDVTWNIPSKGEKRTFQAYANQDSTWDDVINDIMDGDKNCEVILYYQAGLRSSKISKREAISSFTPVSTFQREINDEKLLISWFNLGNICVATQLNYLIKLDSPHGTYIMGNVTYESSSRPQLELE